MNTNITDPFVVFVFGSNLAGRHGAGAALSAKRFFGAITGHGAGAMGRAYAIPTKDHDLNTLPLNYIEYQVKAFIDYARLRPAHTFIVTAIGCGLAGYKPEQIAPMFKAAPENVFVSPRFIT